MMQDRKQNTHNGGFTLIEIMLVTVIIGILAGMVVVVFAGQATDARIRTALGDIKLYESALDMYALDNNDKYPPSLDSLVGGDKQYVRDLNKDPWGNQYNYVKPGVKHPRSYDLFSSGPDGVKGTEDDVAQWLKTDQNDAE
ncbi:MAG: type II secretion system protein GspG [Candidatus Hydrogenedentota bacterium]|nr:MAG: type II secretion system protein GspG [Candidatus Hydrogenedentota bacterium]